MKGKIAIIADEFALDTPTQHLLDRFLIGFQSDGVFHDAPRGRVTAFVTNADSPLVKKRRDDYGLKIAPTPSAAVQDANGVVICAGKAEIVEEALKATSSRTPVFFYGFPSSRAAVIANDRGLPFDFGTEASSALHLPPMRLPSHARISDGLIISSSETFAFDLMLSVLQILPQSLCFIEGQAFWEAGQRGDWSWRLLRAALSRTDKALGNTLLDGRTEDIVSLSLVQSMARNPRGWLIHTNQTSTGQRIALLNLEGVVEDHLLAAQPDTWRKKTHSTQIFFSPRPECEEFSRMAMDVLDFFSGKRQPNPNCSKSRLSHMRLLELFPRLDSMRTGKWQTLFSY